jgi:hypothetical protein
MPEAARIFALSSVLLLIMSLSIWTTMLRGPLMQRLDGRRESNVRPAELASRLLALALGLSAISAIVAVGGWLFA